MEATGQGEDLGCINLGTVKCQEVNRNSEPAPPELEEKPLVMKKVTGFRELWYFKNEAPMKKYVDFSLTSTNTDTQTQELYLYNPLPQAPKFYSDSFVEFFPISPVFSTGTSHEKTSFTLGESPFFKRAQNLEEESLPFLLPPIRYEFLGEIKNHYSGLLIEQCQKVERFYKAQQAQEALETIIMPSLLSMTLCTCDNLKNLYQDDRFSTVDYNMICSVLQAQSIAASDTIFKPTAPGFLNTKGDLELLRSVSFWRPIPYPGYICLGDVASNGLRPVPDTEDDHIQGQENLQKAYDYKTKIGYFSSYCVKKEFTKEVVLKKTGADANLTLIVDKNDINKGSFRKHIFNFVHTVKTEASTSTDLFKNHYQVLYIHDNKTEKLDGSKKIHVLNENFVHFIE